MALARIPKWGVFWLVVSSLIVCWDFLFVLNRPSSFNNPMWMPYKKYIKIDKVYGDMNSNWVVAQSLMNILEVALNFVAVGQHFMGNKTAVVTAFVSLIGTFWKTVAYFMIELVSGHANTLHNTAFNYWVLYIVPNGAWIVVPLALIVTLWGRIVGSIGKVVKGKKHD